MLRSPGLAGLIPGWPGAFLCAGKSKNARNKRIRKKKNNNLYLLH